MGEDKRDMSKNPNTVFAVLGVVAVLILAALMLAWSRVGYRQSAHQVSSQPPSGRCSVSENQQSDVPPVEPADSDKSSEMPGNDGDSDLLPPVANTVDVTTDTIYIVQSGDTLSGISAATGVSVDRLAQANGIMDVNLIYKDSALVIPASR